MELNFEKTIVPYIRKVGRYSQTQEQTQQVRLPDTLPDIQNIIACWGQVMVRGKEWRSGHVEVTGGVKAWVIYTAEDGQKGNPVEAWLPFQFSWDIPDTEHDGDIIVEPLLCSIDARALSDRKILVRATAGMVMEAFVSAEVTVHNVVDAPAEVQVLRNTYPMLLPVEAGEKMFQLEEPLDAAWQDQDVSLLRYNLVPVLEESKIVSDKLVMRGKAVVDMLYIDSGNAIHSKRVEIPWSQYTQLNLEHDQDSTVHLCFAVTDMEIERVEQGGLSLRCGIVAQYLIYENNPITLVEDAYGVNCNIKCASDTVSLPAMLDIQEQILRMDTDVQLLGHEILDISLFADMPQIQIDGEKRAVTPSGSFQILSADVEGKLCANHCKWDTKWMLDTQLNVQNDVSVSNIGAPEYSNGHILASIRLVTRSTTTRAMDVISAIEVGETMQPDAKRPSIILRPIGNESLWEIAKSTGSTIETIQRANEIQQPHNAKQMLLIPIS